MHDVDGTRAMRRARRLGPVAALAVAALLSGCGGGGGAQAQEPAATSADLPVVTPSPADPAPPASSPVPAKHPAKSAGKSAAEAAPAQDTVMLTIKSFTFMPMAINLRVGQTLVVTNLDEAAHTITASDGSFDSGRLEKGQSFRFRPTKPGTYDYYCDFHQYMTGTIEVS